MRMGQAGYTNLDVIVGPYPARQWEKNKVRSPDALVSYFFDLCSERRDVLSIRKGWLARLRDTDIMCDSKMRSASHV